MAGKLIVLTGPSGVGKGTLRKRILQARPDIRETVSVTTREMRPGETEGQDYFFVSRHRFLEMIQHDEFIEWTEYAGNCYGTPKHQLLTEDQTILMEIEVQGALNIKQIFPDARLIFVAPPSLLTLEARIRGRNTNDETDIERRLEVARLELQEQDKFDCVVINDELERCTEQILMLLSSH